MMTLATWLSHGDELHEKDLLYDAVREWEGAFSRALRTLGERENYQELVSEFVIRLQWICSRRNHQTAVKMTRNILKILQKMQKSEDIQVNFFLTLLQQLMTAKYFELLFLLSGPLLSFAIQHETVIEKKRAEFDAIRVRLCQNLQQYQSYKIETDSIVQEEKYLLSVARLVLFIQMISQLQQETVNDGDCLQALEMMFKEMSPESQELSQILTEHAMFLVLVSPIHSQIRRNLSLLKEMAQKQKDIGKRQQLLVLRESLIRLVQSVRQGDRDSYQRAKKEILGLFSMKHSLFRLLFSKIEAKAGFKTSFPFLPF